MENTLVMTDSVTRIGYTVIDDVKVVQYTCTFPLNDPTQIRISSTRLKPDLYKVYREQCRTDLAIFEDAAYELQDEYIAKMSQ